ncbi:MAG: hypothetical protein WC358_07460 [Ignavibacteria bacterium]|jgi:hypothetical protein
MTALQRKIKDAINGIEVADNSDNIELFGSNAFVVGASVDTSKLKYHPKVYGELSRRIAKLDDDFRPFAECIVAFIDQWTINGGANDGRKYGYEICSTVRSWYVQQNIITGPEYKQNGLSWSLYKKALSINVYYLEEDQISEISGSISLVKKPINFEDGSARKFIEDAQAWFGLHKTRTGVNIKIYGVYPDLKTAVRKSKATLKNEYMESYDTVFWGGLFSTYSNFTNWEYHPQMMPNEVWRLRQNFLNNSFVGDGNEDIVDLIDLCESITVKEAENSLGPGELWSKIVGKMGGVNPPSVPELVKYLSTTLEIMEEDFISLYNLKVNINTSKKYQVENLFDWAKTNPYSLQQTITLYRLSGDTTNSVLFYRLQQEIGNTIIYKDGIPVLQNASSFQLEEDEGGNYTLTCKDMFGDTLRFPLDYEFVLPADYMPDSSDFDLIDLSDVDADINPDNPMALAAGAGEEISNNASALNGGGVNEFGPLSSIDINPSKALYNADAIADAIFRNKIYNEMITPPMAVDNSKSKGILDITVLGKRLVAGLNSKANEMIQPDKI